MTGSFIEDDYVVSLLVSIAHLIIPLNAKRDCKMIICFIGLLNLLLQNDDYNWINYNPQIVYLKRIS